MPLSPLEMAMRDKLIEHGRALFDAPKEQVIQFSGNAAADALLNDLAGHPHAFVLACLMDRQVKYKRAWLIPYKISEQLGGFSIGALSRLSPEELKAHFKFQSRPDRKPEALHRFVEKMSGVFHSGVQRIMSEYAGDASRIWVDQPSSAEAVYRFLQFDGAGPKIASMAVNILARDFKVKFADFYSIDISADVHVSRVFSRLGLCTANPTVEQVVYKARAIHPQFPGILDLPCWEIGEAWCKPTQPRCGVCYMNDLCPKRGL